MFLRYNLFTIAWAIFILILILMPGQQMPDFGNLFSFDKLAHLVVFAVLSFLMIIGFAKQYTYSSLRQSPVKHSIIISLVYASMLELGQAAVPDRYANIYDLAFNIAGVCTGYLLFVLIYKFSFH